MLKLAVRIQQNKKNEDRSRTFVRGAVCAVRGLLSVSS